MNWLTQIIAGVVMGLLKWLESRHGNAKTAVDADRRRDALSRIGNRVRDWERQQNGDGQ